MSQRHATRRDPRAHWLLLALVLVTAATALLFQGWTTHELAVPPPPAPDDGGCANAPAPDAVRRGGPVLRLDDRRTQTAAMPAGSTALTFDGGPDPVWTPRLLDLLRAHHAHGTFFLTGAQALRHPDLVRRILSEGHELGSYTYTGADLGSVPSARAGQEQSLTQTALAGTAGVRTRLLRLPHTSSRTTLCGTRWQAARRAAADGYLLVAADRPGRSGRQGAVLQFSETASAYARVARLLGGKGRRFTTVTAGLGLPPATTPVSTVTRWKGRALVLAQAGSHAFVAAMTWLLAIAGTLTAARLVMLVVFARAHVRRTRRSRGRGKGAPRLPPVSDPVTVLVPAHNEEAGIEATIRSLLASTHEFAQIIVIDDGSTDRTAEIARSVADRRVTVIRQANAGKAAALNTGLEWAYFGIVVMVDADTVFEPDALRRLIQPLADPAVGAVSGNTKVGNRRRLLGRWQHLEYVIGFNLDRRLFDVLECMPTVPGAIGAFRRDALVGVGGVSEDTLAEDTDLTMALCRAGWRVVYEESAVAWTEAPASPRQLWRQRYRWCYGTLQAMWKHRHALVERGPAGRLGRRGLTYLGVYQTVLPLLAPIVDVFALYGALFVQPTRSLTVWLIFLGLQLTGAAYALRLDREQFRPLWTMPLQFFAYRQLMYLVVAQSMVTALLGSTLSWHRAQRSGSAAEHLRQEPVPH
jgi:cellulose synthase/poly-beta-1,6-N-acetylglucosamine synthase-like glycosyltransferase/peptidoglycan/xylan/chitin deacetylase (PgdA/CDA1 family)